MMNINQSKNYVQKQQTLFYSLDLECPPQAHVLNKGLAARLALLRGAETFEKWGLVEDA